MSARGKVALLVASCLGLAITAGGAASQEAWRLMSRHGECVSLADAAARKPEFQGVRGPEDLIARLEAEGVAVHRQDVDAGGSRAVVVDAPSRGLNVIFVPPAKCR